MKDGALLSKGGGRMTIKKENWKEWLKATGIRTVKTIAQTGIATIGTAVAMGQVDWLMVCSASSTGKGGFKASSRGYFKAS